jgi:multidrug transporter EmrE-like cation transporter
VPESQKSLSLPAQLSDAVATAKAYALQETVDPLKKATKSLGWSIAGSVLGGIGVVLLLLAGLRALQTETGPHLTGNWSWVPYLIVAVGSLLLAAVVGWRIVHHELAEPRSPRVSESPERQQNR